MDDLTSKISQILGSPEGMAQLRSVAAALGLGGDSDSEEEVKAAKQEESSFSSQDTGGLGDLLSNLDIGMLMKAQQAFSSMGKNDKNTELLRALKPHFHEERSKRVDEAIRIMQLIQLLPFLKESGLFEKLLGGDR